MIRIRRNAERGVTKTDWLLAKHSFSFNRYYEPEHVHFGPLVVLNHDRIQPGMGFPKHPHDNMEIVTYVLQGSLEHSDSTGSHGIVRAGELQFTRAGKGITHSEYNHSKEEMLELLQIWFLPRTRDLEPSYEQRSFPSEKRRNVLCPVVSGTDESDALVIDQDVVMYLSLLCVGKTLSHKVSVTRGVYLYLVSGVLNVNGHELQEEDAIMLQDVRHLTMKAQRDSAFILFDLPMDQ